METNMNRLRSLVSKCDVPTIIAFLKRKDTHAGIQFLKYAVAGGCATVMHMSVLYFLSYVVLPSIDMDLGDAVRSRRAVINNSVAFLVSGIFVYIVNVKWVFVGGRHKRWKEITLFLLVTAISFVAGTLLLKVSIERFSVNTHVAYVSYLVSSVLINFVCRKFIVFKR